MGVRHIKVEHFGTLMGGAEAWSMGHQAFAAVGSNDVAALALLAATTFAVDVFGHAGVTNAISPNVAYLGARVRVVSAAGITEQVAEELLATPQTGTAGAGGFSMPPECAVVVSYMTAVAGARGRGRGYFPPLVTACLTATGRLLPAYRDSLCDAMKEYFDVWNADPTALAAGVASNTGGFVTAIDRVRVGDVIDTQRRRRDALLEAYKTEALA